MMKTVIEWHAFHDEKPTENALILLAWEKHTDGKPYVEISAYRYYENGEDGACLCDESMGGDIVDWDEADMPTHWASWPTFPSAEDAP